MNLPKTLKGEMLYSRYVRHMTLLGVNENQYLKYLLKKSRASIHPYLTIGIEDAAKISDDSITAIYAEQTLGKYFSYFLPVYANDIYEGLLKNDASSATRASQVACFKESEVLSLKFCPRCAEIDIQKFGVTYWHLVHQIPGIEACSKHQIYLVHKDLPPRPYIKPNLLPITGVKSYKCPRSVFKFARFSHRLFNSIKNAKDSYPQEALIERLFNLGYVTKGKRFCRKELSSDFFQFIKKLEPESSNLFPQSEFDYKYLSYLLSAKSVQHPFKVMLFEFWLSSLKGSVRSPRDLAVSKAVKADKEVEIECQKLLKSGLSLAKTSSITRKSISYLKVLAIKTGIPIHLKQTVIDQNLRDRALKMARQGFHRKAIAKLFQISTGSVEQIISTEEGLVEKRRRYKWESKRRKYKVQILREIQRSPSAVKQEIKMSCYAAFHWLYKYEKEWLNKTVPKALKPMVHRMS